MQQTNNKVYVNPNFTRSSGNHPTSSGMYVNPKFTHLLTNVQSNYQNKSKVYVNPDFMKSKNAPESLQPTSTNCVQQVAHINHSVSLHPVVTELSETEKKQFAASVPISKSRYCIIRQNAAKASEKIFVEKSKTTIQVNKYKSIPLNDIKKRLENTRNKVSTQLSTASNNRKYVSSPSLNISRKLINQSSKLLYVSNKNKTRVLIDTHRKILLAKLKLQKRGGLKKNNIPCPMFRKFGKCLRNNCEFLHDRKHVIICRNFLKGMCHNANCLLSHDLTTKKMPTCYFYLQGTCTKSDCPYLHVKLSDKVKICPDFVKGYCEKGNTCILRHVDIHTAKKDKGALAIRTLILKKKYNKTKDKKLQQKDAGSTQNVVNTTIIDKNENNSDCRYYQEHRSDLNISETCEILKPMRCKLGTLPSFIQL